MKAEVILPLVAMILQAGVLLRQGDMLHRQNDLISEIQHPYDPGKGPAHGASGHNSKGSVVQAHS